MRTVVGIRPDKRVRQASSHTEEPTPTVWFNSWRQLAGVLSDENRALLRLMRDRKPRTVLELAEWSGRAPGGTGHRVSDRAGLMEKNNE